MSFVDILQERASEAGFNLSELQLAQFNRYFELLIETNKKMNLTALTAPEDVAVKHMVDSLLAYNSDFSDKTLADVGTGAGFPGIPLKILCPSLKIVLIDSLGKRLKFLDQVIQELQLENISCRHLRAEDAGQQQDLREHFDIVTARAVARLSVLAEYCLPLVKKGGRFIALKGSKYAEEMTEAEIAIRLLGGKLIAAEPVKLPGLDDGRAIITISKNKATPKQYPRKAGTPEKHPLGL